jgi:substrate-binding protein of zinc uptake complex component A
VLRALGRVLAAAAPAWAAAAPDVIAVVTTSTDLKALVAAVGGERVAVDSLAPPLHDPHAVEITPGQLARLRSAALLVRIGLDHEPWLARVRAAVNDPRFAPGGPSDLDLARGIDVLQSATPRVRSERGVHVHGFGNPHCWLDPTNARPMTQAIADALARLASGERETFARNRARLVELLGAPLLACLVLTAIHVYLGLHVLARGVIFVDLALAQVAAIGVTVAFLAGHPIQSEAAYGYALTFTLGGAALLPQEAIIGIVHAVSAAAAVLSRSTGRRRAASTSSRSSSGASSPSPRRRSARWPSSTRRSVRSTGSSAGPCSTSSSTRTAPARGARCAAGTSCSTRRSAWS